MAAEADRPEFVPAGYRVVHALGAGQTSRVYLAQHERYGSVALKIPRDALAHRPVLRRMFENEVQITLKLDHPHVVRAYSGHPTGPEAYLALEYCAGGTLDQLLLEKGRMGLERSLQLVLDVSLGLVFTHDAQVLHRDVKPANVFIDDLGRAKLGDFGTGTFMAEDTDQRVGTAFYMAPEIFEGGTSTVRSDVYSLGVLAYEVMTGVRPFLGDSYDALMMAHLTGVPRDPRRYRDDLSQSVARTLLKTLSRDPSKRFGSVAAFVDALRDAAGLKVAETSPEDGVGTKVGRRGRGSPGRSDSPGSGRESLEKNPGKQGKSPGLLRRLFGFGKE